MDAERIRQLLSRQKIATMPELKAALGTEVDLTVFRKLRELALESLKLGHGGDLRIAELPGLDPGTVARGRRELLSSDVEKQRVRRKGGGRPASEKKRPR